MSLKRLALIAAGSVFFGVTLPVLLCVLNCSGESFEDNLGEKVSQSDGATNIVSIAKGIIGLEFTAILFCGPGAIILGLLLYSYLRLESKNMTEDALIHTSIWRGAFLAFANIPGFLAIVLLGPPEGLALLRVGALYIVAGATSGMWVAWQVCRQNNPQCGFLPRYRLSTLMGIVIAWAALLAFFAP